MTEIVVPCPRCGKKLYSCFAEKKEWKYGNPIKVCKNCGQKYIDDRYHEIAVEGAAPDAMSVKQGTVCFCFGLILAAVMSVIMYLTIHFGGYYYMSVVVLGLMGLLMTVIGILQIVEIKTGIRERKLAKYQAESLRRLQNKAYVRELESLGYLLPDSFK